MKSFLKISSKETKRLVYVACFIVFLFCTCLFQFYKIQIIQGDKWYKIATYQHQTLVTEYFQRGSFYSNTTLGPDHPEDKVAFVIEVPKYHLYIDPDSIPYKHKKIIAKKINETIKLNTSQKEKVIKDFFKKSRSRKVLSYLDKNKKKELLTWWIEFSKKEKIARNALFFVQDYKRSYPFGSLLGQILHTVQDEKDPFTFQSLPTGGLEFYFNDYLKGNLGKRIITRSPRHPLDTGKMIVQPENGGDIFLTINHYLQAIAEEELEKGINNVNAKSGWAIMMDPNTGEILAFAQKPSFDLRNYSKYFNDESLKEHTKIKALTDPYEPGSIMKPLTLAICMKANEELIKLKKSPIFYPTEKIACANGKFPGRPTPLKDGRVHKYLNMYLAIQKSSNIYFAKLVERVISTLGKEWYYNQLSEIFSFGKKTGIELPYEDIGFLPQIDKLYSNQKSQWSDSTPYSLAIGYNILVNSIQIVKAYSIIVNGGYDVKPTIVRKIIKNHEIIIDNTKNFSLKNRKRLLSKHICEELIKSMKYSTKLGGTSKLADIEGYTEGGKSATAEKNIQGKYNKDIHISSFIGFAPAKNPKFVLLITIDEPEKRFVPNVGKLQHGGICAAPVFKEISKRSLKYLGVAPDDPFGYPYNDHRYIKDKADWANEVKTLSDIYKSWNE